MTTQSEKVKAFLNAISDLSLQSGLSLSHEDWQGSFIVEDYDPKNIQWLNNATDETTESVNSKSSGKQLEE